MEYMKNHVFLVIYVTNWEWPRLEVSDCQATSRLFFEKTAVLKGPRSDAGSFPSESSAADPSDTPNVVMELELDAVLDFSPHYLPPVTYSGRMQSLMPTWKRQPLSESLSKHSLNKSKSLASMQIW